jgi:hypothetical protein
MLLVTCVLHDLYITTDPCCALCVLSTPSNMLCIVMNNTAEKDVTLSDGDVYLKN